MKKLVLVDGSGFLFRAWYAISPIINDEGKNINVVFGFSRMMTKLLSDMPDYFVIAWDSPTKTKRHEKYDEYKANRRKMEDEFKQQIPRVMELVDELWIPNIKAPWYEADDIVSTLVNNYRKDENLTIQVYTSDKDLKQFLDTNIVIVDSLKNQTTTLLDFEKEYGFEPRGIVDYLALIWDSADNIKGVPWIGPKGALNLIQDYKTIENIYEHLGDLSPSLKSKLEEWKESAFFSKELIELMDVPELLWKDIESLKLTIDFNRWDDILLKKWKFNSLQKKIDELKKKMMQPIQLGLF